MLLLAALAHCWWRGNAVLKIFQGKGMNPSINSIHIALISKKNNLELVSEFRLISLWNMVYKLVSKVICNKLKAIMPLIISRMQSAFIPSRLITNNIMVTYELLHSMKLNKKKRKGVVAIKLDMFKAYNRIEWP